MPDYAKGVAIFGEGTLATTNGHPLPGERSLVGCGSGVFHNHRSILVSDNGLSPTICMSRDPPCLQNQSDPDMNRTLFAVERKRCCWQGGSRDMQCVVNGIRPKQDEARVCYFHLTRPYKRWASCENESASSQSLLTPCYPHCQVKTRSTVPHTASAPAKPCPG